MVTGISANSKRTPFKILERRLFQLFPDNLAVVLDLLTLQDKRNIHTLSVNIELVCVRCETDQKPASKVRTNKLYISRQYTYIVSIELILSFRDSTH
jgi:hypothetical protein